MAHYWCALWGSHCEILRISTLHCILYDSDEGYRWDDVNLDHGGLEWHFAVDPNVSARNLFPTHPTALLGRIIRTGENNGAPNRFARTTYVQQYFPPVNSACLHRRVLCRMNRSNLRFVLFYVRTATTEVRDLSNSVITILRYGKKKR